MPSNKIHKFTLIKLAAAAAVIFLILRAVGCMGTDKSSSDGFINREVKLKRGELIVNVVSTGEVKPQNRLEIKPAVAGRIEEILVREGQKVKKGEVLAWMSSNDRVGILDAIMLQPEADRDKWKEIYKPTPILAPIDGTVIVRKVEPGQSVSSGDAVLVLADRLLVKAQVAETDVGQVQVGQKARIRLDAYRNETFEAAVDHIAYESETVNNVTTYKIDVLPAAASDEFVSGMTADVEIEIMRATDALLIPMEAVTDKSGKKSAMLKEKGRGKPKLTELKLGVHDLASYEVLSGAQEGDVVVFRQRKESKQKSSKKKAFLSR